MVTKVAEKIGCHFIAFRNQNFEHINSGFTQIYSRISQKQK